MARHMTPWTLAEKVDEAVNKARDGIDRYNEASDDDASEKELARLAQQSDALIEKASDLYQSLVEAVEGYWSEYEWLRSPAGAQRNGLFSSLLGSPKGERKGGGKSGKREKEYDATCLNKHDPDDDVHPAATFRAPNKTEAKAQVWKWLKGAGYDPRDFTIEVEEYD